MVLSYFCCYTTASHIDKSILCAFFDHIGGAGGAPNIDVVSILQHLIFHFCFSTHLYFFVSRKSDEVNTFGLGFGNLLPLWLGYHHHHITLSLYILALLSFLTGHQKAELRTKTIHTHFSLLRRV